LSVGAWSDKDANCENEVHQYKQEVQRLMTKNAELENMMLELHSTLEKRDLQHEQTD
jgi:hypothetical protein